MRRALVSNVAAHVIAASNRGSAGEAVAAVALALGRPCQLNQHEDGQRCDCFGVHGEVNSPLRNKHTGVQHRSTFHSMYLLASQSSIRHCCP